MSFLVKMSGQPSSYVQRFARYEISSFWDHVALFCAKKWDFYRVNVLHLHMLQLSSNNIALLSCNHTNYYQQAIPIQSLAYINTTYNQQVLTLQLVRYTYTNYNLQAITFQPTHSTYTTFNLK